MKIIRKAIAIIPLFILMTIQIAGMFLAGVGAFISILAQMAKDYVNEFYSKE